MEVIEENTNTIPYEYADVGSTLLGFISTQAVIINGSTTPTQNVFPYNVHQTTVKLKESGFDDLFNGNTVSSWIRQVTTEHREAHPELYPNTDEHTNLYPDYYTEED